MAVPQPLNYARPSRHPRRPSLPVIIFVFVVVIIPHAARWFDDFAAEADRQGAMCPGSPATQP
jgi:hypothetical protein